MESMKHWWILGCIALSGCARNGGVEVHLALQPPSTNNYPSYFAQWLGFYRQEGLDVTISQIAGASKVLQALIGGSADVGGGVFEQSIQMAAERRSIVTFISLARSPNFAVVAAPGGKVKTLQDLRGKTVGVSSAGSPSQFYLNYLLIKSGMQPADVSIASVGMGATAVAAVEHQQVDAAMLFGSAITALEARRPDLIVLADTRTSEGLRVVFGVDDYPASSLVAKEAWLKTKPDAARRVSRAVVRSLTWLREHSAEEIFAQVPAEFRVGDPAAEIAAIKLAIPMYSIDGRISPESAEAVRQVLAGSLELVRNARIDLSRTYTNEFLP
jgi:NitT/TauT family transport system substrate-binding protein